MGWKLLRSADGSALIVTFRGKLHAADGAASAEACASELQRGPVKIVWNLEEMTGYEPAARVAWQRTLWPVRQNILGIEVVGGSPIVRLGAVTISMTLGIEATFVDAAGKGDGRRRPPRAA